jgi:RNA-binding protein YhbY
VEAICTDLDAQSVSVVGGVVILYRKRPVD